MSYHVLTSLYLLKDSDVLFLVTVYYVYVNVIGHQLESLSSYVNHVVSVKSIIPSTVFCF